MTLESTFQSSTIMVTGGCGFIGSHLVQRLVELGAKRVVVIDSLRYGDQANLAGSSDAVEVVQHTLGTDPGDALAAHMTGVDYLFHLAAEKHNQSKDSPARVFQANITGTHTLFETAVKASVKKILFTSSLYAYGRMDGPPFVETELPAPRTVYGISKLTGEHLLRHFNVQHGMPYDVIRYLFVYGPKQFAGMGYKSVIIKNFEQLLDGKPATVYGDGEQALDYVYVDDAVDATLRVLARAGSGEVFNVASGKATSVNHLLDTMMKVAGKGSEKISQPADWTAGSHRVGSIEKIREQVGWQPATSLEEGLARTWEWTKAQR